MLSPNDTTPRQILITENVGPAWWASRLIFERDNPPAVPFDFDCPACVRVVKVRAVYEQDGRYVCGTCFDAKSILSFERKVSVQP